MSPPTATTISSEKLEKVLEVNAKAIEINTIVSTQYERILEKFKSHADEDNDRFDGLDEVLTELKKNNQALIASGEDVRRVSGEVLAQVKAIADVVNKVERSMFKISVLLIGSSTLVSAIVGIIAKVIFKV